MNIFRYKFLLISLMLACLSTDVTKLFAVEDETTAPASQSSLITVSNQVSNIILDLRERLQEPYSGENLDEIYQALKSGTREFLPSKAYLGITELIEFAEKSLSEEVFKADLEALREYLKEIEVKRAACSRQSCFTTCPVIPNCPAPCPPCNPCTPTACLIVGCFTVDSRGNVISQLGEDFVVTSRLICSELLIGGQRVFEYTVVLTRNFCSMISPIVSTNDASLNARLEGVPTNRSFKIRATIPSGINPESVVRRFCFEVAPIT